MHTYMSDDVAETESDEVAAKANAAVACVFELGSDMTDCHLANPDPSPHHEVADAELNQLSPLAIRQHDHRLGGLPGALAVQQLVGPQCIFDSERHHGITPGAIASSKC
jgi:hypothetical protein